MKAFVGQVFDLSGGAQLQTLRVIYHNNTGFVERYEFDIYFTDAVNESSLRGIIATEVLNHAAAQSYTMTAADIVYGVSPTILRVFANPTRSLNSAFQISTTRDALVSYSVDIAATATLIGGQTGTVFLEYADDSGFTTNVKETSRFLNGNSVSLAIAVTVNQNVTGTLSGLIPAAKYVRIRTANTVGTPTFNFRSSQEVLV